MTNKDAEHFDKRLKCQHYYGDPRHGGCISRPRLWWIRTAVQELNLQSWGMQLLRDGSIVNTHLDDSKLAKSLHLHPSVIQGQARIRCFTTPAPTDAGRDEPKENRQHISPQARHRWMEDNRQYAPWHYEAVNMVQPSDTQPLRMLSNDEKEQLHHIPRGYTATGKTGTISERDRGRVIGNGWHLGVARIFVILALLAAHFPLT